MLRRWRVRHSYPKSIVELVVQLEPVHGAVALSRLLDIPTSVIYRWRTSHRDAQAPACTVAAAETLATLVARCEDFGLRVTPHARAPNDPARASVATLHGESAARVSLGNGLNDKAVDAAPSSICRDGADRRSGQRDATDEPKPSWLTGRYRATGRYVFDARKERPVRKVRNRMETARQAVDTQYFLDVDCRTLAEIAQMSLHHFIRMFGDMFGMSPHQYLTRVRVNAAKRLLLFSSEPIEVIAVGVGFRSGASLNRAFKRIEGTSISRYCETLKKGGAARRQPAWIPAAALDVPGQTAV